MVQIPAFFFFVAFFEVFATPLALFAAPAFKLAYFQAIINQGMRRFLYQNNDPSGSKDSPKIYTPPAGEDPFSHPFNQAFSTDPKSTLETTEILSLWLPILAFYILFIAALVCISSTFQGAFVRAAAEVFAGRAPCFKKCLEVGQEKIFDIICYGFLYILIVAATAIFWVTLATMAFQNHAGSIIVAVAVMVYMDLFIYFSCSMMGTISAIIVENKGAMTSMKRPRQVGSSSICFIFCSAFIVLLLEFIGKLVIRLGLRLFLVGTDARTAAAILAMSGLGVSLLIGPLNVM